MMTLEPIGGVNDIERRFLLSVSVFGLFDFFLKGRIKKGPKPFIR
jgi:hypothetical protein